MEYSFKDKNIIFEDVYSDFKVDAFKSYREKLFMSVKYRTIDSVVFKSDGFAFSLCYVKFVNYEKVSWGFIKLIDITLDSKYMFVFIEE